MVYVLDKSGKPLMPTKRHGKIRHLLDSGKAKVVQRTPFTIQLTYDTPGRTQPVKLGIDAGSRTVGYSATTETEELYASELKPRNDVVKLLSKRREKRRARRNRTTRHRPARFNNRVHSKHKGWLAPSVEVKIHNHIQEVMAILRILPVTEVTVETAEFDLQLIKAMQDGKPLPEGTDYQQGEMYGFYNVRQYVFFRDHYTCQCCGAHGDDVKLEAHHLETRQTGGYAPDVFTTLCVDCHRKVSQGSVKTFNKRKRRSTRDMTFMGIMRKTLLKRLKDVLDIPVYETKGYITKCMREMHDIPKSHINDARCISGNPLAKPYDSTYLVRPVRRHNRKIHKETVLKGGIRKLNQQETYIRGYRLYDKVRYRGQECFIFGRRKTGYFDLRLLDGTKIHASAKCGDLELLERSSTLLKEKRTALSPTTKVAGLCA